MNNPDRALIWKKLQQLENFDSEKGLTLVVPLNSGVDLYQEIQKKYPWKFHIDVTQNSRKAIFLITDFIKWAVEQIVSSNYQITLDVGTPKQCITILKRLKVWVNKRQFPFMGSTLLCIDGISN